MTANLPARFEPIPPLDPKAPELESLPQWASDLNTLIATLRKNDEYRVGAHGRKVVTIPATLTLSETMQAYIARRIDELEQLAAPGPQKDIEAVIATILIRYGTNAQDEVTMRVKADAYRMVLREFPAWIVRAAWERWLKGTVAPNESRSFAPPESALYRACKDLLMAANGQRVGLQMVLDAEPYAPPTEEELIARSRRLEKMAQAIAKAADPEKHRERTPHEKAELERIRQGGGKSLLERMREESQPQRTGTDG